MTYDHKGECTPVTGQAQAHGERIRKLLAQATHEATIIAPFIKVGTFRSLIEAVPKSARLVCVTRWRPQEVAAGISDVEVIDVLEERGDYRLTLVDRLHAKVYMSGSRCLVGSANVTAAGLGEGDHAGNVELLVDKDSGDPYIVALLEEIARLERSATKPMADAMRALAQSFPSDRSVVGVVAPWHPRSRKPDLAFTFYSQPPSGFVKTADRSVLRDLSEITLPPGLSEKEFKWTIREMLAAIEPGAKLLRQETDVTLTRGEALAYFERAAEGTTTPNDLWNGFVEWMAHFFPDKLIKQEVSNTALRRAVLMQAE